MNRAMRVSSDSSLALRAAVHFNASLRPDIVDREGHRFAIRCDLDTTNYPVCFPALDKRSSPSSLGRGHENVDGVVEAKQSFGLWLRLHRMW